MKELATMIETMELATNESLPAALARKEPAGARSQRKLQSGK